jgi:hypothetical protein
LPALPVAWRRASTAVNPKRSTSTVMFFFPVTATRRQQSVDLGRLAEEFDRESTEHRTDTLDRDGPDVLGLGFGVAIEPVSGRLLQHLEGIEADDVGRDGHDGDLPEVGIASVGPLCPCILVRGAKLARTKKPDSLV